MIYIEKNLVQTIRLELQLAAANFFTFKYFYLKENSVFFFFQPKPHFFPVFLH